MANVLRGKTLALYLVCVLSWGSTWLVIRIGVRDLPPLTFAAIRMTLACLLLVPIVLRRGRFRPDPAQRRWIAVAGFLLIGLNYALAFLAARYLESGLSALLFSTFAIWVGIFAHVALPYEPLTARNITAALLGLAGVAIIQGPELPSALSGSPSRLAIGGGFILAGTIVSAMSNIVVKKYLAAVPPAFNLLGQTLVGTVFLALAALLFERGQVIRWTPTAVGAIVYLAVFGTVIPFIALFWLIPRVPVALVGTIPFIDTVIAILLGAAVIGERLPSRVFAGAVFILVGVFLAAAVGKGRETAGSQETAQAGSRASRSARE
ncbi:MAG TPA: EamA family transporter [Thermoanaerobaculia bacterium]|jgi:drug/metabolite transporter (DMT)-like permease